MAPGLLLLVLAAIPRGIASFSAPAATSPFAPDPSAADLKRELYRLCEGTRNGVDADDRTRGEIGRVVGELEAAAARRRPRGEDGDGGGAAAMTDLPLRGSRHELLYCESEGGSSGKIGPFVGDVEQLFASSDDESFANVVTLGPLRLALSAERKILDERRIRVKFQEIKATLFGLELFSKPTKGAGVWTQRFVDDELRIMDAPSLFIIRRIDDGNEKQPSLMDVLNNPADFIADE